MVTESDFLNYYEAQMSGKFNMIMDAHQVMEIYHIEKNIYLEIINNYNKYYNEYIR